MNRNFIRIGIGTLLGIAVLSVLVGLLPQRTPLVWTAFGWSVGALVMFALSLGFWATGSKTRYILNAAYPLLVWGWLFLTLAAAFGFVALECFGVFSVKVGWFVLIELAVLAIFAWRILSLDAGREAILATEDAVKVDTVGWKMLVLEMKSVADRAADLPAVVRAAEAVRCADPMEHPAVEGIVNTLRDRIAELDKAVTANDAARGEELCTEIERLVKKRADALLMLK